MVFRKTLTGIENYPVHDCGNMSSPIPMELSLKPKMFSDFVVPFLQSASNFKHFEKKLDRHIYFISEITECEKHGWTTP